MWRLGWAGAGLWLTASPSRQARVPTIVPHIVTHGSNWQLTGRVVANGLDRCTGGGLPGRRPDQPTGVPRIVKNRTFCKRVAQTLLKTTNLEALFISDLKNHMMSFFRPREHPRRRPARRPTRHARRPTRRPPLKQPATVGPCGRWAGLRLAASPPARPTGPCPTYHPAHRPPQGATGS